MRIIAGEFSSRKLITREGNETRPTLDKVKEAVFSSLGTYFDTGTVLDLYAGSGAIGLEALSRGMQKAIFVDSSRDAIRVIKENVNALKVNERCRVLNMKAEAALELLQEEDIKADLVYLDPPYAKQRMYDILAFLDSSDIIKHGSVIVLESGKEDSFEVNLNRIYKYKEKVYGITRITYCTVR